jgi:signal transduction histidine kinase
MPEGGRLDIAVERAPEEGWARLSVQDTGVGIAPDLQSQIFEPFFTTKDPDRGGGLGLSIVYSIVRDCGGSIHVTSEPGRGTRFDVLLPLA